MRLTLLIPLITTLTSAAPTSTTSCGYARSDDLKTFPLWIAPAAAPYNCNKFDKPAVFVSMGPRCHCSFWSTETCYAVSVFETMDEGEFRPVPHVKGFRCWKY